MAMLHSSQSSLMQSSSETALLNISISQMRKLSSRKVHLDNNTVQRPDFSLSLCYLFSSILALLLPCRSLVLWPQGDSASSREHSKNGARGWEWRAVPPEPPHGPHPYHAHVGASATAAWHAGLHLHTLCNHRACNVVSSRKEVQD